MAPGDEAGLQGRGRTHLLHHRATYLSAALFLGIYQRGGARGACRGGR